MRKISIWRQILECVFFRKTNPGRYVIDVVLVFTIIHKCRRTFRFLLILSYFTLFIILLLLLWLFFYIFRLTLYLTFQSI